MSMQWDTVGHKKEQNTNTFDSIDEPWKQSAKWKKPLQKTIYCVSLFIWNVLKTNL